MWTSPAQIGKQIGTNPEDVQTRDQYWLQLLQCILCVKNDDI